MAKLCSYCGVALKRDDARFCQNCGKPTSPRSLSPAATVDLASSVAAPEEEALEDTLRMPAVKKFKRNQPALPEQIAQQPGRNRPALGVQGARQSAPGRSALQEQIALQPPASRPEEASAPSSDAPKNTPMPTPPLSLDDLPSTPPLQVLHEPQTPAKEENAIEDSPTLLLESSSAEAPALTHDVTEEVKNEQEQHEEDRDTLNLPLPVPSITSFTMQSPQPATGLASASSPQQPEAVQPAPVEGWQEASPATGDSARPFTLAPISARFTALPDIVHRLTAPVPAIAQAIPTRFTALPETIRRLASSAAPLSGGPVAPQARQRLPMTVVAAVIVALVLVGVGSWLLITQPFSIPAVTQPQLGFSDAQLGFSLFYPNGWTYQKDAANSTVQFSDSSRTAQVMISISALNNSTITSDLQKKSAQLGLSGAKKAAPLSFAGMSWQAMQGTVQQDGANYTCAIFATTRAGRLVMLTQLAPQSVYNEEDGTIFSALRQSLRFF